MKPAFLIFITILLVLSSCEGFIRMQGRVVDHATQQPLENVQVLLVLKGRDTLENTRLYYDTIAYEARSALRKKGVKDDYNMNDPKGLSQLGPSRTDSSGNFSIGNILVGCVPKCPTCQLLFLKDGYVPIAVKLPSIAQDSLVINLQKTPAFKAH